MDNTFEIASEFYDKSIRAETVLHLATMCAESDAWPSIVSDAFAQDAEQIAEALDIPELADELEDWEVSEWLMSHKKLGFLVLFGTPNPEFSDSGEVITASWGWTRCQWFYSETYDQACRMAIEWRDRLYARQPVADEAGGA